MLRLVEPASAAEFSARQRIGALKRSIPPRKVKRVLRKVRGKRRRVCPVAPDELVTWLIIGLGLFAGDALRQVWRWLVPGPKGRCVPGRSTLCEARRRLGPRVLMELAKEVIRPLASLQTGGAFYKGLHLVGIDSCCPSLFDSPENRRTFNPPRGRRPPPAYPQAKLCCLCELGTHVMFQWLLKPVYWADCKMAPPLLKRLGGGTLLMWDANFYSYGNLQLLRRQQAQLLGRLSWAHKPQFVGALSDGSYLARLYPNDKARRLGLGGVTVRVIEYEVRDPARSRSSKHKRHRLLTTLLDERAHPASELAELYHRRWELEMAIDELETHQLQQRVLASQTPAGVVQEVAGLMLAHYLLRQLMLQASEQAQVPPTRISFTATLKILRCRLGEIRGDSSPGQQRQWWARLVEEVSGEIIEVRRDRINPRVLKRTTVDFPRKRASDYDCPQPTRPLRESIVMLR